VSGVYFMPLLTLLTVLTWFAIDGRIRNTPDVRALFSKQKRKGKQTVTNQKAARRAQKAGPEDTCESSGSASQRQSSGKADGSLRKQGSGEANSVKSNSSRRQTTQQGQSGSQKERERRSSKAAGRQQR
jgi:hypothetical protein